jgi:aspartate/tyrosine/aromatic aminotransferase
MFENVTTAPADPILGLTEAFKQDPRPGKINLSVGVYQDDSGTTPVLPSVKEAERRLLEAEKTKGYKPISGDPEYGRVVQQMLFGASSEIAASGRAATAHAPGGTGGLRVIGDYLAKVHGKPTLWMSDPTWPNHPQIFAAADLVTKSYAYFDQANNALDLEKMLAAIAQIPAGDVILLHACCHNPTGADPSPEQWGKIGQAVAQSKLFPVVDFAYQGFAEGIVEDARGLNALLGHVKEAAICSSFSKNFGLYNERTGALTLIASSKEHAAAVMSQVKVVIRSNYSNPPAHGGSIVTTILNDAELTKKWEGEVLAMRERIATMRKLFVATLKSEGVPGDFSFIERQRGMFSFSGLSPDQVKRLKEEHAVYIVNSGRINVAGMTTATMPALCKAIRAVS